MRVSLGKKITEIDGTELAQRINGYRTIAIDLGTGNGHFAYRLARMNPHIFCIGIDPVATAFERNALRARRKPSRGGVNNLLYVAASLEQYPAELTGIAQRLFVLFPWGNLLRGLLEFDPAILGAIHSICRPAAHIEILINDSVFRKPVSKEAAGLPIPDEDFIRRRLAPCYARRGLIVVATRKLDLSTAESQRTLWGRRLGTENAKAIYISLYTAKGLIG